MIVRHPFFRLTAVVLMSLLAATGAFAQKSKRRAVSPSSGAPAAPPTVEATLTGTVTEAGTGAPVVDALVSVVGKATHTDASGKFTLKIPTGRDVALNLGRTGFQPSTVTVNISGDATRTFQLTPKATTKIRNVTGGTFELDTETVEFGYVVPFSGYIKGTALNLCKAGGVAFTPDRADIDKISGPVQLNDATCCASGPMPAVTVTLKSGETSTAALVDACVGYKTDIIGRDHRTNAATYVHFSDLAEIDLP